MFVSLSSRSQSLRHRYISEVKFKYDEIIYIEFYFAWAYIVKLEIVSFLWGKFVRELIKTFYKERVNIRHGSEKFWVEFTFWE